MAASEGRAPETNLTRIGSSQPGGGLFRALVATWGSGAGEVGACTQLSRMWVPYAVLNTYLQGNQSAPVIHIRDISHFQ